MVDAACYVNPDGRVGRVLVRWYDPYDSHCLPVPTFFLVTVLGPDVLKFDSVWEAGEWLAARDAVIGNLTVVNYES